MDPMSHLLLLVSLKLNFKRCHDKRCHVCFIVVEEKARAILSRDTPEELAILKLEINALKEETLPRDFPECFKAVGKLKGF